MKISWSVRLLTALIWMLAAASGVYWALRMSGATTVAPFLQARTLGLTADDPSQQAKLARLLGASGVASVSSVAPAPPVLERFTLTGVISTLKGQGAALISVDGQPARPFLVGMQIVSGYMLKAVSLRAATLVDDSQSLVTLVLPPPASRQAPAADPLARAAVPTQRVESVPGAIMALPLPGDVRQQAPPPPSR